MTKTKEDFVKRKAEIEKYFQFLTMLDKDNPVLHFLDMGVSSTSKIEDDLLKILKANGFLLIYNLVESTCRNSLFDILLAIQSKKLSFGKFSEEVKILWIKQRTQNLRDLKVKIDTVDKQFCEIAKDVIENSIIDFSETLKKLEDPNNSEFDLFGLSGNINTEKIRTMAKSCGFNPFVSPEKEKAGVDLDAIKVKRNHLAHGRITFAECGKVYSVKEMCKYKDNAILYLDGILENIEAYIKAKQFKLSKVPAL